MVLVIRNALRIEIFLDYKVITIYGSVNGE